MIIFCSVAADVMFYAVTVLLVRGFVWGDTRETDWCVFMWTLCTCFIKMAQFVLNKMSSHGYMSLHFNNILCLPCDKMTEGSAVNKLLDSSQYHYIVW
jgi:hypothetical protein